MNKRLLIFGIDRHSFWLSLAAGMLVFFYVGLVAAVSVYTITHAGILLATREDHKIPEILVRSIRLGLVFDSSLRQ